MDKILSKDTIKNVFAALGAKTSDSNYGVALLDKTSGEPKGFMGMSDLASVLGGLRSRGEYTGTSLNTLNTGESVGCYLINPAKTTQGMPIAHWGLLIVSGLSGTMSQMFYDINGANNPLYFRVNHNGSWDDWKLNYDSSILTDSSILSPLASALGGSRIQEITMPANSYIDVTVSKNSFYKLWPGSEIGSSLTFILTTDENDYTTQKLVFFGTSWAKGDAYKLSVVDSSTIRLTREQSTNYVVHLQQISW